MVLFKVTAQIQTSLITVHFLKAFLGYSNKLFL